eukprot:TRINITY_DN4515_c0_g1_i1.p1 TRINITY_DN4515_c0_g1~~TRINITY_DN4515_c0_g1_i1.p1  ORF type:complete len:193 (+),score=46.29 TRINITY_DN4515_c0_g1_i1:105-683(+)
MDKTETNQSVEAQQKNDEGDIEKTIMLATNIELLKKANEDLRQKMQDLENENNQLKTKQQKVQSDILLVYSNSTKEQQAIIIKDCYLEILRGIKFLDDQKSNFNLDVSDYLQQLANAAQYPQCIKLEINSNQPSTNLYSSRTSNQVYSLDKEQLKGFAKSTGRTLNYNQQGKDNQNSNQNNQGGEKKCCLIF